MRLGLFLLSLLAAIGGLFAYTHLRAAEREARADSRMPPASGFVTVEGRRIRAEIMGSGPDLILIHGSSGNVNDFRAGLMARLAARYRVIAFDRPGLGFSDPLPKGGEGITDQARILSKAAAALGVSRALVLGQSYGGAVALAWAAAAPGQVAGLVLVSAPSQVWSGGLSRYYRVTSHPVGAALAVPFLTAYVGRGLVERELIGVFAPQEVPAGYVDAIDLDLTLARGAIRANARQRARLKADVRALRPAYADIIAPVEIIHGDQDQTVPLDIHARPLSEQIPAAHLHILPGVGHMPHHGASRGAVIAAIDRAAARAGLRPAP